jgi:pimeloyl-ACP methyl ester carboxylesterase
MIVVQTPAGQVAVQVSGTGEPLLLIPGFPLDHRMWNSQLRSLSQSFQVIAPDLRGFGASSKLGGSVSLRDYADDLIAIMEQLAPGRAFTVCGLSMGGYIAWQLVRNWPERVARLILCHTRAAADSPETARGRRIAIEAIRQSGPNAFLQAMLERVLGATTRQQQPELVARVQGWMAAAPAESLIQTLEALATRPDATPWLEAINCPTLVIAGTEDPITPAAEMRELAGQIAGSQFVLLEQVGHLSPCESPEHFDAVLQQFLRI